MNERLEWLNAETKAWEPAAINREWTEVRKVTRVPIRLVNIDTNQVLREYFPPRERT